MAWQRGGVAWFSIVAATGAALLVGCGPQAEAWKGGSTGLTLPTEQAAPDSLPPGWPALFGPAGNSVSPETGLSVEWPESGPQLAWERPVGRGYSTPVTWGERLVLLHRLGDEEVVSCLNSATGDPLWEHRYPTAWTSKNDYSDGPYSTPVLDGEFVYTFGGEGKFHCLRLDSGEVVWQRDLKRDYEVPDAMFSLGSSPLLEGDRLIVILGALQQDAGLVALDRRTGETLWKATDYNASYCTPKAATIHGRRFVFALMKEGLVAVDPADGKVHWFVEFASRAADSINATTPAVWRNYVLLVAGPGPGSVCLEVQEDGSYKQLWQEKRAALDAQFNTLIPLEGFVYGFTSKWNRQAEFRCIDLRTGAMQWEFPSAIMRGQAAAVDGRFILLGEEGHLASVDADPGRLTVRSLTTEPVIEGPCYSAPIVHDGRLYLRNEKVLRCYPLRAQPAL